MVDVHANAEKTLPGHILTGPIAIEGAQPGDVLEVRIEDVQLRQDWGYNVIRPLAGTLQSDFHEFRLLHIPLDLNAKTGRLPWGTELELAPFFGVMGGWPRLRRGAVSRRSVPRAFGGDIDNKELVAGTTLFLPVFRRGRAVLLRRRPRRARRRRSLRHRHRNRPAGPFNSSCEDLGFTYPRAETPTHYITMGMDPDLDRCAEMALRDMIVLIGEVAELSRDDAYTLCSLAADLRVTQTVNGSKGIHCMLTKSLLAFKAA